MQMAGYGDNIIPHSNYSPGRWEPQWAVYGGNVFGRGELATPTNAIAKDVEGWTFKRCRNA
jgi:hypothetical protein